MGFWGKLSDLGASFGSSRLNPMTWPGRVKSRLDKDFGSPDDGNKEDRARLNSQVDAASGFANMGTQGFVKTGAESEQARQYLRDLAEGKNSIASEQLRQGLQQNVAAQRSQAASAAPGNAAMAARTAAMQSGRLGFGMSGQQAIAGLQERQQAQQMLNDMILKQRQQELEAALQGRATAVNGLNGTVANPQKGWWEKYGPAAAAAAGLVASDTRLKEDIDGADDESRRVTDALKAYTFKYKDEKHGKGKQFGVMAQELERAGLGHAVIDTPEGKMVHGAKLATSNTAMIAALGKRVAELEGKGR